MKPTLAFDVYGTLIDTNGVITKLEAYMPQKIAHDFAQTWRQTQLAYSFRRGLMKDYVDFSVCTRQALDYSCDVYKISLTQEAKNALIHTYKTLPAFADVKESLTQLKQEGYRLFAFSNGKAGDLAALLQHAQIHNAFLDIISLEDIKTYKPDTQAYAYFLKQSKAKSEEAWLISSNPFDIIGATSAGFQSAWVQRSDEQIYDPWDIPPTITIKNLAMLSQKIAAHQRQE